MANISSSTSSVRDVSGLEQDHSPALEMKKLPPPKEGAAKMPRAPDRRPSHLQHQADADTRDIALHPHTDAPEDPHVEVPPGTSMMATLTPAAAARSAALRQLHKDMREVGVSREELDQIVAQLGGRHAESASAGVCLASLNDHVGIASFPFKFRASNVGTHLLVLKDSIEDEHGKADLYFVKGYANRVVSPRDLLEFEGNRAALASAEQAAMAREKAQAEARHGKTTDGTTGKGKGKEKATAQDELTMMETYFCTFLLQKSKKSVLFARRSVDESSTVLMPVPPNATKFPRQFAWANSENYMAEGFGDPPPAQREDGKESDFRLGYSDLNGPENRDIIFITAQKYHDAPRPMQSRPYGDYPASLNVGGGAIAQITGFDDRGVEIVAPASAPGVKNATVRQLIEAFMREKPRDRTLIVRTEDQYRHKFEYTTKGLKMSLLDQHGDPVKALSPLPGADVSVYGWRGENTGPYGSPAGYANSMIILSTGEEIPAAPFLKDRHSLKGIATAASHAVTDAILNDVNPMVKGTTANGMMRSAIRAVVTASTVYGMNALMNTFRDEKTHTLFDGAQPFSGSGAGLVDAKTLAGAIAVTVLAQDVVSVAYRFAYKNFVKDTAKNREHALGQIFNEAMLPFFGEVGRLMLNYGIQTGMGLPRGNEKDIYSLFGVATMLTAIEFLRGRSGDQANHLFLSATYKAMDFFAADLVFRSLGAVYGSEVPPLDLGNGEHAHSDMGKNYLEAFVTRMGVRGVDKALLPILALVMAGAGLAGDNARAGEDQLARENAGNNMVARLRDLLNIFSVDAERMLETGRDKLEDIEGLRRTAVLVKRGVESMRLAINHLNLDPPVTARAELDQVRAAARFHAMSEEEQVQHLKSIDEHYQKMIASSDVFSGRQAPPLAAGEAGPSEVPDLSLAVSNSIANVPKRIRETTELLMKTFPAAYAQNQEVIYPTAIAPDFISAALPHTAKPTGPFAKTERIPRQQTTFTDAQVPYVKEVQRALGDAPGMPRQVSDSNPLYRALNNRMIDDGREATHAYSLESQLFHYLLRWAQTGQAKFLRLAPGVWFQMASMNHRGNVTGERDRFVTPLSVLMVNLMALHGKTVPHNVYRAVVTDAHYIEASRQEEARKRYGPDAVFIGEGALIAMTEFMSVTSSKHMAATFLQGLGYGAAPIDRSQQMVIHQETAVTIIPLAEHMQVESLLLAGSVGIPDRIDHNPPPEQGRDLKQKRKTGGLTGEDDNKEFNLGQVLYIHLLDTFQAEVRYHHYLEAQEQARTDGKPAQIDIEDGAICCHPQTSQLYRYHAQSQTMVFTGGTLNNFHGAPLEPKENEPARWRQPYTSALSPDQIRIGILGAILTGHAITPFLNDATRNVSHEKYREKGGYYDASSPNHKYKLQDDARRDAMKERARAGAIPDILGWSPTTAFEAPADGRVFTEGRGFPGEMLARVLSSALHRPMMVMEVDAAGALVMEQRQVTDHNDEQRTESVPVTRRHFLKTHDLFDLTYDAQRAPMLGVGPNGYYVVDLSQAQYRAVPVRIAGNGLTAGNLVHAFLAAGYPNPNQNRYQVRDDEIKSATDSARGWRKLIPGSPDYVANSAREVLQCLKNFARSDYDPIDQWLDQTYTELHGEPEIAPKETAAGTSGNKSGGKPAGKTAGQGRRPRV